MRMVSAGSDTSKTTLTSDELIEKLRSALRRDGDFPASAKIVSELRQLTSDPKTTANQITEVILREPSLGTRILHLVNSSFYRRAKPIMTVSQAVIQIGMRPLAELCAGLVLLQKFVPAARQGGAFANCLRKTVLTSLLSGAITTEGVTSATGTKSSRNDEYGYLAGSFTELGTLLLAYYFPQVYEAAVKRGEAKKQEIGKSILEITGLSPLQLSLEVIDALDLPVFYKDVLSKIATLTDQPVTVSISQAQGGGRAAVSTDTDRLARAVSVSRNISEVMVSSKSKQDLDKIVAEASSKFGLELKALGKVLGDLPNLFRNHCMCIDLQLPSLPEYVATYSEQTPTGVVSGSDGKGDEEQFTDFVNEIRQAVENREPTSSIITSVMETLAFGLKFDRVLLLLVGASKNRLACRLLLGNVPGFDPKKLQRPLGADADPHAPDARAYRESRPVFAGTPLFEGAWPLAALPIGFGARAIGVIYADRNPNVSTPRDLSAREQASIGVLAELLDRSISLQS